MSSCSDSILCCLVVSHCLIQYHMDLCNQLCLFGQTNGLSAVLNGKNFGIENFMQPFFSFFWGGGGGHACHAYWHHWLLPFYTTFSELDLGWGSQGQHKMKSILHRCWLYLLAYSSALHLIRMKIDMTVNQFKLKLIWWWISSSWVSWYYL